MRVLLSLLSFLTVCLSASTHLDGRTVVSLKDLAALGIAVERMQLSTPMASVEIGALVDPDKSPGQYVLTECVVLNDEVSESKLAEVDAGSVGVARRSDSTKVRSIFLVRGKEVPNAYLAFEFSVRTDASVDTRRYLLPIAKIAGNRGD